MIRRHVLLPFPLMTLVLAAGQPLPIQTPRALPASQLQELKAQEPARMALSTQSLEALRTSAGLDGQSTFVLTRVLTDQLGTTHTRFQQRYQGVRVMGGDAIAHLDAGGRQLPMTDALVRGIQLNVTPSIDVSEALATAHRDLAPKGPYTHTPTTELVVWPERTLEHTGPGTNAMDYVTRVASFRLAYHIHTELENGTEETRHMDYLVDAHTGAILKKWDTLHTTGTAATGTGNSQYSGVVTFNTNQLSGTNYQLRDTTRGSTTVVGGVGNAVTNLNNGTTGNGTIYSDTDNAWGDSTQYSGGSTTVANGQTAAVDAAFGIEKTWDYYNNIHFRNGIDGSGTSTILRVHYSTLFDNAFWDDTCFCMTFGDGSGLASGGFTTLTSIDVAGHEMSHGVTSTSANLDYSGESGGLNESNSDINGTMVEFYAHGGGTTTVPDVAPNANFLIGEQLTGGLGALRAMYKPSLDSLSPDYWYADIGSLDVHFSSGPMNRCFYFLSQGATTSGDTSTAGNTPGNGVADANFLPTGMAGIGNDAAARIWYQTLTTKLTSTSDYRAARAGAVASAAELYGALTPEYYAVQNAFHGINVGTVATVGMLEDTNAPIVSAPLVTGNSGTITISATATDDQGVARVDYFIDGVLAGSSATGPDYLVSINSTEFASGSHTVVARAYDTNINFANSSPTAFDLINPDSQFLLNPGFELNYDGWVATPLADIETSLVLNGTKAAWLGGYGQTNSDNFYQQFTVPSFATTVNLSYWVRVSTADASAANKDTLLVQILSSTGTVLKTLKTLTNRDEQSPRAYVNFFADLSAYKGQTIRLRFSYSEDAVNFTSFRIDDVMLSVSVPPVAISVPVSSMVLVRGGTHTFTASVTGNSDTSVTWSVQPGGAGGTIDAGTGLYTAPALAGGTDTVIATSVADPTKTASINVQIINDTDLNTDGKVDGLDLGLLALKYGTVSANEDLNASGGPIDDADLDILNADFGR